MKNRLLAISMVTMACTLCACGTQGAGTSAFTEGSTEQAVMTEERTEQTASDTTEQAEATGQTEEAVQTKKPSYLELDHILDEINTDIYPGTAGSSLVSLQKSLLPSMMHIRNYWDRMQRNCWRMPDVRMLHIHGAMLRLKPSRPSMR